MGRFLQYMLPAAVMVCLRRPRSLLVRLAAAVLLAWPASVYWTAAVYNPAGIAAAYAHPDAHDPTSPEMRYDNNTTAVMLLGGWMMPLAVASICGIGLRALRRLRVAHSSWFEAADRRCRLELHTKLCIILLCGHYLAGYAFFRVNHQIVHRTMSSGGVCTYHEVDGGDAWAVGASINAAIAAAYTPLRWIELACWHVLQPIN